MSLVWKQQVSNLMCYRDGQHPRSTQSISSGEQLNAVVNDIDQSALSIGGARCEPHATVVSALRDLRGLIQGEDRNGQRGLPDNIRFRGQ